MTHISSAELRRRADVQDHYVNGGRIESRNRWGNVGHTWAEETKTPVDKWDWYYRDYRPYVEPPKPKEGWSYVRGDGSPANLLFPSKAECERWYEGARDGGRAVLMREVIE